MTVLLVAIAAISFQSPVHATGLADPSPGFVDVQSGPHQRAIQTVAAEGITVGCDEDGPRYCPRQPVTRAQMATFLVRALDTPAGGDSPREDEESYTPDLTETLLLAAGSGNHAAVSPDDTRIAYGTTAGLWVMDIDGANISRLVDRNVRGVQWSFDGTSIFYYPWQNGRSDGLWLVNSDGSGNIKLRGDMSGLSPDSTRIAYETFWSGPIAVQNIDGSNTIRLARGSQEPRWSPDGKKIAYIVQNEDNWVDNSLWIVNSDGSDRTQLIADEVSHESMRWSPDSNKIAYEGNIYYKSGDSSYSRSPDAGGGNARSLGVRVVNADGSNTAQLVEEGWFSAWSPDGTKIAYQNAEWTDDGLGRWRLTSTWAANADGSGRTRLLEEGYINAWSPDGAKIAYSKDDGQWVMDADGSNRTRLDTTGTYEWSSTLFRGWSSDGTKVYYYQDGHFWIADVDGSNNTRVTRSGGSHPSWSADGTRIAYSGPGGVWVMDANGSGNTRLTDEGCCPDWSPDGTRIVYHKSDGVWVMDPDGSDNTRLITGDVYSLAWSPDGTKIAYSSNEGLLAIGADGTGNTKLADGGRYPDWSPDGTRIAYSLPFGGTWIIHADGTGASEVTDEGCCPDWSPDGTRIAYHIGTGGTVFSMDPDGSNRTAIGWGVSPTWSPDGKWLATSGSVGSSTYGGIIVMDGKEPIYQTDSGRLYPVWSPESDKIAYSLDDSILVLSGFAPESAARFRDVGAGVHRPAIDTLADQEVFTGTLCAADRFCPGDSITRWVMAVWLVRALEGAERPATSGSRFADVDADEWWSPYVERLAELGITKGCAVDPVLYCPDKPVSRAEMASFLVRAFDISLATAPG